jgi:cytochrome c biogenesis protein CcdA
MRSLATAGSILTGFFGGAVALFSPCCIVFLLPAYLGVAVKDRRWRLLPLTLAFAAGLAFVMLPVTLGIRLVVASVTRYHVPLYVGGGVLLLGLAVLSLSGRTWSLPSFIREPDITRADSGGAFALGVFSGVASSCCAPVLAGVATVSALSSGLGGSLLIGLAYVLGMTFPLFVLALLWDRFRLGERRLFKARTIRLAILGRTLVTNTINVAVAVVFAAMAAFVFFLAASGSTTTTPGVQIAFGRWLERSLRSVTDVLAPVPELVWGLALLVAAGLLVFAATRHSQRDQRERSDDHDHACASEAGDVGDAA